MTAFEAIADPVRLAVVRHLAIDGRGTLADLAEVAGVHVNTIRAHVAPLERAGLLVRDHRPATGRGRRPVEYRLAEGWAVAPGGFLGLAELLATLALRRPSRRNLRRMGRQWAARLGHRLGVDDPLPRINTALQHLGFQAHIEQDDVFLAGCPCPLVAPDRPELICELAVGAVEGAGERLQVIGRGHDPTQRRCRLKLAGATGRIH